MSFSDWLKEQQGNKSLNAFSRQLNIPYTTLRQLIAFGQEPKLGTILKISVGLGLPVEDVMRAVAENNGP